MLVRRRPVGWCQKGAHYSARTPEAVLQTGTGIPYSRLARHFPVWGPNCLIKSGCLAFWFRSGGPISGIW